MCKRAWDKNAAATKRKIVDGTFSFDEEPSTLPVVEEVEKVYWSRLECTLEYRGRTISQREGRHSKLYGAFFSEEVSKALGSFSKDLAAGVDVCNVATIKKLDAVHVFAIFNFWWANGIPEEIQVCRTIVLPKGGERSDVNNWRPIKIGNLLMRLYAKVWDWQIRSNVDINPPQKGFVPTNGCFSNIKVHQHAIWSRRRNRKEVNIVFLDLAKAFDTVVYNSIWEALLVHQVLKAAIEGAKQIYGHAITNIQVGRIATNTIPILRGVKEGCPRSLLLFDLVMDELLKQLQNQGKGIQIGDQRIAIITFVHHLVLVNEEAFHMNMALHECGRFFHHEGLKVNVTKCTTLRVLPVKEKKFLKVMTDTLWWWKNLPMPSIGFEDLYKYLGVSIQPDETNSNSNGPVGGDVFEYLY